MKLILLLKLRDNTNLAAECKPAKLSLIIDQLKVLIIHKRASIKVFTDTYVYIKLLDKSVSPQQGGPTEFIPTTITTEAPRQYYYVVYYYIQ